MDMFLLFTFCFACLWLKSLLASLGSLWPLTGSAGTCDRPKVIQSFPSFFHKCFYGLLPRQMLEINQADSGRLFVYTLYIYSESLLLIGAPILHPGPCGARHRRPPLPHDGLMGSIRPLQSVRALQRSTCSRWRCRAPGEAMVVELLLPVWHLTAALAAAKCLDALRDSRDPRIPLREW